MKNRKSKQFLEVGFTGGNKSSQAIPHVNLKVNLIKLCFLKLVSFLGKTCIDNIGGDKFYTKVKTDVKILQREEFDVNFVKRFFPETAANTFLRV